MPFNVFVPWGNTERGNLIREGLVKQPTAEELYKTLVVFRLILPKTSISCNAGIYQFGKFKEAVIKKEINNAISLADPNNPLTQRTINASKKLL